MKSDRQIIEEATDYVIRMVNRNIPTSQEHRAQIYYYLGNEFLYLAATVSGLENRNSSDEVPVSDNYL